ncbi:hypothetical protein ANTHELSMS3_01900 [Antarctobacter heliothermus]|uniref:DUF6916 domain-containing protein n=1 Tax=Antarctobacter heliothermus TaxID=74033 RepID=A0A222E313_9RHOB|nr:hypothetical protein [Antarctobacter heliothermus]ASP20585.1 hypothetical protein ANTHELSMS3_01900 [Antarctobacter heliothermus]
MGVLNSLSRRAVLAGQAALAGLAALPGAAMARTGSAAQVTEGVAPVVAKAPRWHDATAEELASLVGERFRVSTKAHGDVVLKLVALEQGASGPARPGDLARRESVTALFDSPDAGPLVADGDGLHRVWHPRMGAADLYMTAVPRRHGGADIAIVLN